MKKLFLFSNFYLLFIFSVSFISCKYGLEEGFYRDNSVEERASKLSEITFTDINGNSLDLSVRSTFSFVVISDVHFGRNLSRPDEEFLTQIANLSPRPDFCLCLGDVAEHGLEEEYKDFNSTVVEGLKNLGIKTFCVTGNHDLYNSGFKHFQKYNYPYTSLYTFKVGNFSFYGIDSASCNLSKPQISELKKAFKSDNNKKIIFTHVPLYAKDTFYFVMQESEERNELISLFAKNNVWLYLGGHIHEYLKTDFGSFLELNVPAYLEQFGWTIVTVDQNNISYDYKTTILK